MGIEDIAQEVELKDWEQNNLNRPEMRRHKPGEDGYGPAECECGNTMPPARREHGFRLCVACAEAAEQKTNNKLFRR